MVKKYQTFLATYPPVGGVIRVVLVSEPDRWVAYFATDPDLSVASILETVADRNGLETGQPHCTSSNRWCGAQTTGYHQRRSAA